MIYAAMDLKSGDQIKMGKLMAVVTQTALARQGHFVIEFRDSQGQAGSFRIDAEQEVEVVYCESYSD